MGTLNHDWVQLLDSSDKRKMRKKFWNVVYWGEDITEWETRTGIHWRAAYAKRFENFLLPSLISPLHDRDYKEDGEKAKDHVHQVLIFDQPQRYEQVMKILNLGLGLESIKYIEPVWTLQGSIRYLIHADNPEKAQYDPLDIISTCGAKFTLEEETASKMVFDYLAEERPIAMTEVMEHFQCSLSCMNWISRNTNFVNTCLKENLALWKVENGYN